MSAEMLNEQIWTSPQVTAAYPDRGRTMTVNGVIGKSLVLLVIVVALASVGWRYALEFLSVTNSLWFLIGYFVLIGLTLMVVRNPAIAAIVATAGSGGTGGTVTAAVATGAGITGISTRGRTGRRRRSIRTR